ncbi:MAG: hypothetical protein U0903_04960 [Planctomycetales bacterium]
MSEIRWSIPPATEYSPTIPKIATVSPDKASSDRAGRAVRLRNASVSIEVSVQES